MLFGYIYFQKKTTEQIRKVKRKRQQFVQLNLNVKKKLYRTCIEFVCRSSDTHAYPQMPIHARIRINISPSA